MEARIVEFADAVGRQNSGYTAAKAFFLREQDTLIRAIRIGKASIAKGEGDYETTARSVRTLEQQLADLEAGWQRSSLRRMVEGRIDSAPDGSEQRSLVASSTPRFVAPVRSTKISSQTTAKTLLGHAATFNKWSLDLGGFREKIAPGAFANSLKRSDVRCLFNHSSDHIFARSTAATLELSEDTIGLRFVAHLLAFDGPSYALARRIDRRDISGCSFSFTTGKDTWRFASKPGDLDERTLVEIDRLFDVGPVVYPAYPDTRVDAVFAEAERSFDPADDDDDDDDYPLVQTPPRSTAVARQIRSTRRLNTLEARLQAMRLAAVERQIRIGQYGWKFLKS